MDFSPEKNVTKEKYTNDGNLKSLTTKEWISLGIIGMLSIIFSIFFNMKNGIQSDIVSYTVWGKDIVSGNLLLSNWIMPTNSFYVLSLLCALIGSVIGFNTTLVFVVAALVYAFDIMLIGFIILKLNPSRRSGWLTVFIVFGIAVVPNYNLLGGAHVDVVSFILFAFYMIHILEQNYKKELWWKLVIAYVLLAFGAFSDNLVLYYGIVPIISVFVFKFVFESPIKKQRLFYVINIVLSIISAGVAVVLAKIVRNLGGFQLAGYGQPSFVSVHDITTRVIGVFQDILSLFGGNFFGVRVISYESIAALCNLSIFIILIILLIVHYKHKKNINTFTLFSIFSIIICLLMLLFMNYEPTNNLYTFYADRLMWSQFFLVLVLCGSIDVRQYINKIPINNKAQFVIIFGLLTVSLLARLDYISFNGKQNDIYDKISKVLQENNLSDGFGSYWYSHAVTVNSGFKNVVYPIDGERPQRFRWISKKVPDDIYANFVILKDNDKEFSVTEQAITRSVGSPPVQTFHVDNVTIYVWNKNIATYFANLLDNSYVTLNGALMPGNNNTVVSDNSMVLNPGGILFGPYFAADKGNYQATILGTNLYATNCDINSEEMRKKSMKIPYKITKQTDNEVVIEYTLPVDITDLEIRVFNNTQDKKITVDRIEITK